MKRFALLGIGFAVGWVVFRAFAGSDADDELIRDSAHELGSSTGG